MYLPKKQCYSYGTVCITVNYTHPLAKQMPATVHITKYPEASRCHLLMSIMFVLEFEKRLL